MRAVKRFVSEDLLARAQEALDPELNDSEVIDSGLRLAITSAKITRGISLDHACGASEYRKTEIS